MAEKFLPLAKKIETRQGEQAQFVGYSGGVNQIAVPDYDQPDAGKRIRVAFVWAGDELRRITTDSLVGTRIDFS